MSDDELREIKERLKSAPRSWTSVSNGDGTLDIQNITWPQWDFLHAAGSDEQRLIDEIERLREELKIVIKGGT